MAKNICLRNVYADVRLLEGDLQILEQAIMKSRTEMKTFALR